MALYSVLVVIELDRMSRRYSGCLDSVGAFSGAVVFFSISNGVLLKMVDDAVVGCGDAVMLLVGLYNEEVKFLGSYDEVGAVTTAEFVEYVDVAPAAAVGNEADVPALFLSNGFIRSLGL